MELDAEYDADGEVRKPAQKYYLKPMNCPMHNLIFDARGRSYRELPLRLFEFGTVYRYEKSGVVHGLTRVRGFTQDDAHIYCTKEQMADELDSLLTFVLDLLRDYGLDDFYLELSTRDPEKSVGTDEEWEEATEIAAPGRAEQQDLELVLDPGGAAFYGPKISVQARDAIGRTWQMSTIQVDFNLPERFDLEYQGADGTRHRPVMIHRALFGSIERFFAVLLEHYAGAFPPWLAPVQVVGIPITDAHVAVPARRSPRKLRAQGIRVEVDASDDRMQKKIRNAQKQKVPVHADRRRRGRRQRARCRSATATASRRTACRSTRRSPRSSPRSRRACRSDARGGRGAGESRVGRRRVRPAVDAAPDGVHPRARTSRRTARPATSARSAASPHVDDDELARRRARATTRTPC